MVVEVAKIVNKEHEEAVEHKREIKVKEVVKTNGRPTVWRLPIQLKYAILFLPAVCLMVQPTESDSFRICDEEQTAAGGVDCPLRLFPAPLLGLITSIQLIVMIPGMWPWLMCLLRILQIGGAFALKAIVQGIQDTYQEEHGTPIAYMGYCLFFGYFAAVLISEKPIKTLKARWLYEVFVLIATIIGMAAEIGLNHSQKAYGKNMLIELVCIIICFLGYAILMIIESWKNPTWKLGTFPAFAFGAIFYVYATIPGTEFLATSWQVSSAILGSIMFIAVFTLTKLSIRHCNSASIPEEV